MKQGAEALCSWLRASCQGILVRASTPVARARACSALTAAFLLFLTAHAQAHAVHPRAELPPSATAVVGLPGGAAVTASGCTRSGSRTSGVPSRPLAPRPRVRALTVRGFGLPAPRAPGL